MERRIRMGLSFCLTLAASVSLTGCKTPRSEIPPAKTFSGAQANAPVSFGSTPNNVNGFSSLSSVTGDGRPAHDGAGTLGTPAPRSDTYGVPAAGGYGPPGSSMGNMPSTSANAGGAAVVPPAASAPTGPAASTPAPLPAPGQGPFQ